MCGLFGHKISLARLRGFVAAQLKKLRGLAVCVGLMGAGLVAHAQPGTILLQSDFDDGLVACDPLGPTWASSDTNLAEVGTFTSQSGSCSVFTRGAAVSITSVTLDTSSITGANLTAWVRKGDDSFSEDPDAAAENLVLEYADAAGNFIILQTFSAVTIADGGVTLVNLALPFGALHSNSQLRFRQLGGSGGPPANGGLGFDFWHIDDVVLTETGIAPPPPPEPTLTANSCDDFENGLANWTLSDPALSGISGATFGSPSNSLFLSGGGLTATSVIVPTPALEQITMFIQRGDDAFSENPEGPDDLTVEFLDDTGTFVALATFDGGGTPGEILTPTFTVPASARHANFQLRFNYPAGSGPTFDFWHIDDVCLISSAPDLTVVKTVEIEPDPVTGDPSFSVPGAFARYTIEVTNTGPGVVDAGSLGLSDSIDENTVLFTGDLDGSGGPFLFVDGTGAAVSGVSLNFGGLSDTGDGVIFSNSSGAEIIPSTDFDLNVASFTLNFDGMMLSGGGGTPTSFSVQYRVRLE